MTAPSYSVQRVLARLKLLIAFSPGEDDVDPDPHRLGAGRHQDVLPVRGFHAESDAGVRLDIRLVVHVHLLDSVEVDATFRSALETKNRITNCAIKFFN